MIMTFPAPFRTFFLVLSLVLIQGVVFAQSTLPADNAAMMEVSGMYKAFKVFAMLFTGVAGMIGGSRVYNKFAQGDSGAPMAAFTWFMTIFFCVSILYFVDLYFR